jgi:hypothetical protein
MTLDEQRIAERGAAEVSAAMKEWDAAGKHVTMPGELRQFAIFMFSKGAAFGVETAQGIVNEVKP